MMQYQNHFQGCWSAQGRTCSSLRNLNHQKQVKVWAPHSDNLHQIGWALPQRRNLSKHQQSQTRQRLPNQLTELLWASICLWFPETQSSSGPNFGWYPDCWHYSNGQVRLFYDWSYSSLVSLFKQDSSPIYWSISRNSSLPVEQRN